MYGHSSSEVRKLTLRPGYIPLVDSAQGYLRCWNSQHPLNVDKELTLIPSFHMLHWGKCVAIVTHLLPFSSQNLHTPVTRASKYGRCHMWETHGKNVLGPQLDLLFLVLFTIINCLPLLVGTGCAGAWMLRDAVSLPGLLISAAKLLCFLKPYP